MPNTKTFQTKQDAIDWMFDEVDDPCVDNVRFAYADDADAVAEYDAATDAGCCGSFHAEVIVDEKTAYIGCNFGH